MMFKGDRCFHTTLKFVLLFFMAVTCAVAEPTGSGEPALQTLVNHWLHWGANWRHSSHPSAPHPRESGAISSGSPASEPPPPYVIGAATRNASITSEFPYPLIMMHRAEADLIASYLTDDDVYLEFGSGGSTIAYSPLVKRAYSIDHNCDYARQVQDTLRFLQIHPADGKTRFFCVNVRPGFRGWGMISPFEHGNYKQFREYVDLIQNLPEERLDKVLIDGRARMACALKILPHLHNDSLVFVHDFYARLDHYSHILQYYTEVSRILAYQNSDPFQGPIDEPQGVVVLRRRPDFTLPPSTEQIDSYYDKMAWRELYAKHSTSILGRLMYKVRLLFDWGQWKRAYNPEQLTSFVVNDLVWLAAICGMVTFVYRNVELLRGNRGSVTKATRKRERSQSLSRSSDRTTPSHSNGQVKYMETEGMKAANARRKRASATALKV